MLFRSTLEGNVTITAGADNSEAEVTLDGSTTFNNAGTFTVTASGDTSDADLDIANLATSTVNTLEALASGSAASAEINIAAGDQSGDITINTLLSAQASGDNSADATITFSSDTAVTLTTGADLDVIASGENSTAEIELNGSTTFNSADVFTITASGASSDADLYIANASGDVNTISVTASSSDATAEVNIDAGNIAINTDLNVTTSNNAALASFEASADVTLGGNVTITAGADNSEAEVTLDGSTTFNNAGTDRKSTRLNSSH